MKIIDAINQVDSMKPNVYSYADKVRWLSTLDYAIKKEIIDTHEGADKVDFHGYDDNTPQDTELLAPAPYDRMYLRWLESQIDYANGEYDKYNNSMVMYNTEYTAFERYYNRTHMPLGHKIRLW